MAISRVLQSQILTELAEVYPGIGSLSCLETVDPKVKNANLFYLLEHGLIHAKVFLISKIPKLGSNERCKLHANQLVEVVVLCR